MKRYQIIYEGIVQGVGFRWNLIMIARSLNLTGFAKNQSNGNVLVEIQGKQEIIDDFLQKSLNIKSSFIKIYDYHIKQILVDEDERIFDVKY